MAVDNKEKEAFIMATTKTNNTATAENKTTKGEKVMKNTIRENRANELKAKKAAEEAAKREAELKDIKPLNIPETLKQLENAKTDAKVVCDKDGNPVAVCGGKYLCEVYKGEVIGAETEEQLNIVKGRIDKGIHGDGLLHKMVNINGRSIPCVGKTEEEVDQDVKSLEVYSKEHPAEPRRDLTIAKMLKDAGYKSENLEQVTVLNNDYLLVYEDSDGLKNYVMDLNGATVKNKDGKEVSLSDIEDELGRKTVKILLLERLEKAVASKKVEKPAPTPAPEKPKVQKKPRNNKVEVTVEIRPCGILIAQRLKNYTLEEVIKEVLLYQGWGTKSYGGNPECPYIGRAYAVGCCMTKASSKIEINAINPTARFIAQRIVRETPIYADSLPELTRKVADIVYVALKDEPYFGMDPSTGRELANHMAAEIVAQADILYR